MSHGLELLRLVEPIAARHGTFRCEAYVFALEALELAVSQREEPGHVSGSDLLGRVRELGRQRYGVMAGDVFNAWGVRTTVDFGRIVFHLVDGGLLLKREEDSLAEFIDRFNFREAFALKAASPGA
ncbi:hypothetical protein DRQ50_04380 [bacterium]|nr:MAG: hypothetical protein DRQ50_04380 [bacterium]